MTDKELRGLQPASGRRYAVPDDRVPGLELRVQADGMKVWSLRYRFLGQRRRLTLGPYPRVGLADARGTAQRELRKVDGGVDPRAERQAARQVAARDQVQTVDALCEAYLEQHAKRRKRSWRQDQGRIRCEVLPRWRGRPAASITRRDCRALVQAIADRPAPTSANRMAAFLSRLFRFAVDEDWLPLNPAAHLPKPGVEAHAQPDGERPVKAYSAEEVRQIWQNTEALPPALRTIYRWGLILGQRPGEISGARWAEIDGCWWTIAAARSKNRRAHRVYLPTIARELLAEVPRIEGDTYCFTGYRNARALAAANRVAFAGIAPREKPRHAMRATVATGMKAAGVSLENVSRVLNHTHGSPVTAIYNEYEYAREKRRAITAWADLLARHIHARMGGLHVA